MQKQYDQSQALLRTSFSHVLPLNNQEKALLDEIILLVRDMKDLSPHSGAVLSTALALSPGYQAPAAIKSKEDMMEAIQDVVAMANSYLSYKKQEGVVPHLKLQPYEEEKANRYLCEALRSWARMIPSLIDLLEEVQKHSHEQTGRQTTLPTIEKSSLPEPKPIPSNDLLKKWKDIKTTKDPLNPNHRLHTRDTEFHFLNDFTQLYNAALGSDKSNTLNPRFVEVYLAAANPKNIPQDFLTLLRSALFCTLHPEIKVDGFPPADISKVLSGTSQEFDQILQKAKDVEKRMPKASSSPKELIELIGEVSSYPRSQDAQNISMRNEVSVSPAPKIQPNRLDMLTQEQARVFERIDNEGLKLSSNEISELQQAIQGTEASKVTPEAKKRAENIEAYWKQPVLDIPWHRLNSESVLPTKTLLIVQHAEMGKELHRLELELLNFANALPDKVKDALLFEIEIMGNLRQPISIRDILIFTARASHFTLTGKNPKLASQEKELLDRSIQYLEAKARQQQLNRAIAAYKELEEVAPNDESAYNRLSEKCWQELNRKPPYKSHTHPGLLVFEVLEDIGLHDWQVKDLDRMISPKPGENPNVILEKVMGSGKSKVYLPIIALNKADGDHLSLIVVHSSQYEAVSRAMQIKSGQNFSQVAHALQFSRESDTSLEALTKIRDECLQVIKQRHFMVATDKSLHSLSLAFSELWDSYLAEKEENPDLSARLEVMREIMNLLKTKGKATLDEADLLLNCRYEVVYSLGLAEPIDSSHANIVAELYRSIEPHLQQLVPFTKAEYLAKKPEMMEAFVKNFVGAKTSFWDEGLIKESQLILDYLKEGKKGAEFVATLPEKERDQLAIAFYEFKELLPIVLDKRCGEHYGYSDNPQKVLPVPYVASGVPSPTAEFSFPYTLLNYTMQTLKNEGVNAVILKKLIQEMQSKAVQEQRADPDLQLQDTQAYKAFSELRGSGTSSEVFIPFLKINDKDIAKLEEMYKNNPPNIYEFAKKYIFPAVTQHGRKLASTPYALVNMFLETQGFTGTPWNYLTFSKGLEVVRDVNSAGKTEGIIWINSQTVHDESTSSEFKESIKAIAKIQQTGGYNAYIDVGATFNGIGNQTVAANLLETLPSNIEGIVFFKDNEPVILERGKHTPKPFESGQDTENLYIYFDQWHTTGTDIPIAGKSLLSIGKNTKMRDLEQGYA